MLAPHLCQNFCFVGNISRQKGKLRHLISLQTCGRRWKTRFAYPKGMVAYEDDYVDVPEYPPIDPELRSLSDNLKKRLQNRLDWYQKIRKQPTVEEKNIQLNMTRRYGWYSLLLKEDFFGYGVLPYIKHVTRTHFVSQDELPLSYSTPELTEKVQYFKEKVREPLAEALKFEQDILRRTEISDLAENENTVSRDTTNSIVSQINRIVLTILGKEVSHLNSCSVDINPNVQAFWVIGGMEPSLRERNYRKSKKKMWEENKPANFRYLNEDEPVERSIHFVGSPLLHIRSEDPIQNFVEPDSMLVSKGEDVTNRCSFEGRTMGYRTEFKFASMIPGYWSGDSQRCAHIGFHASNYLSESIRNNDYWRAEDENSLKSQAILVSFARLISQAFFYGFDQFSDLSYPFSTQTVITDGFKWSFFSYQLNTIQLDHLSIEKNNKQNICWGTKSMNIFDEKNPDQLNDAVIENLLKFYLNPPHSIIAAQQVEDDSPFLNAKLTNYEDEKVRAVMFANYRDMLLQKQDFWTHRHRQFPEVYDWEWIYKIKFPMRPMDKRVKFFALPKGFPGSDPYNQPYTLRDPTFISKGLRRHLGIAEAKQEAKRIEAAKLVEKSKFAQFEK